ncbi:E3 ubiquitin-protein ligase TRIM7-like [Podarcis lilfordi]|uniref:E3 ubiquitin-protein ligase TRIM7-like n=1 Tax=Podarcis lilfordi TaxID=74358 RepID=A0AA35P0R3_9SAUR|nr:E3 ubiquitin-protein ligase TRIM7-like [Podarcis lilfordi]
MAAVQGLCDEATCSVCQDYFRDPVTLDCGHNFCRACLAGLWEGSGPDSPSCCPECKEAVQPRNFKPNRQLANVAELLKKLQEGEGGGRRASGAGQWRMCQAHQEPLKLFCKDDEAPICVVCDRSKEHREHRVCPMEEASQEYKEQIKARLESLKDEREKLVEQKLAEELRRQECVAGLEMEKQKIRIAFEKMQEFLEEKLNLWLGQLEDVEKEMGRWQEENLSRLSEEISQLSELIVEMEDRSQQPASEFLQDIRSALSRHEKNSVGHMTDLSPKMEEALRFASQKNSALEKALESSQDSLTQALNKVSVTLDPETASPKLLVSEDLKSVRRAGKKQDLPDNPERFDWMPFVLGREGFTSGRPTWEVEIETVDQAMWALGVAKDSVRRKGPFKLNPNEGVWALKKQFGESSPFQLVALSCPEPVSVTVRQLPRKIRVSLDYEGGLVEFFDADANECLFTFFAGSFLGEKIRPFFLLGLGVTLKC